MMGEKKIVSIKVEAINLSKISKMSIQIMLKKSTNKIKGYMVKVLLDSVLFVVVAYMNVYKLINKM